MKIFKKSHLLNIFLVAWVSTFQLHAGPTLDVEPLRKGLGAILEAKDDVPALLLTLHVLATEAKQNGNPPPDYNMCNLLVLQNETFCQFNRGINRINMPQLIGKPIPDGKADKMVKDGKVELSAEGEVNLQEEFKNYLRSKGAKIDKKAVDAYKLKATQSELVGHKVAGMWFTLKQEPNHPALTAPIFVSADDFVLDGHHRWAAIMATKFGLARLKVVRMPVLEVNRNMTQLLKLANDFITEYGIAPKPG